MYDSDGAKLMEALKEMGIKKMGHRQTIESPDPGLDLSYSEVVGAVHQIWRQGYIKADFKAEQDRILAAIAKSIQKQLRENDLFARYGGEEFVLLLPGMDQPGAKKILVRLCDGIAELAHPLDNGESLTVTLSAGIATFPGDGIHSSRQLMQAADEALYAAKQRGRNRVVLADATTRKSSDNNDHSGGRPA